MIPIKRFMLYFQLGFWFYKSSVHTLPMYLDGHILDRHFLCTFVSTCVYLCIYVWIMCIHESIMCILEWIMCIYVYTLCIYVYTLFVYKYIQCIFVYTLWICAKMNWFWNGLKYILFDYQKMSLLKCATQKMSVSKMSGYVCSYTFTLI